jgi:hypothetical protein
MEQKEENQVPVNKMTDAETSPNTALEGAGIPPEPIASPEVAEITKETLTPEPPVAIPSSSEEGAGENTFVILLVALVVAVVLAGLYFVGTRYVSAPQEPPATEVHLGAEAPKVPEPEPAYKDPQTPTPQALDAIDEEVKKDDLSGIDEEVKDAGEQL